MPVLEKFRIQDLKSIADLEQLREGVDLLALPGWQTGRYAVGFAVSRRCVERALRLRYQVFNLELGEGLASSVRTGLDEDIFDEQMTHVVLMERASEEVVGTYRIQTLAHALAHHGIYAAAEYDLTGLEPWFHSSAECGRACIHTNHRSMPALVHLWRGLRAFLDMNGLRWIFGCCSLTSTDPDDGWRAMKTLRADNSLHETLMMPARADFSCGSRKREFDPQLGPALKLPKLFRTYIRLGSRVVSEPALDRGFGTVDFLILQDAQHPKMSSLVAGSIPGLLRP